MFQRHDVFLENFNLYLFLFHRLIDALADFPMNNIMKSRLENISTTFEKQHSKNKIFVYGRIHAFTTENISSSIEVASEFG